MLNGKSELQLQDEEFITGSDMEFNFTILDKNGDKLILTGSELKWTLCYVDQKETPLVVKDNKTLNGITILEDGLCSVKIQNRDTESLFDGLYEHELIIIQPTGKVIRPCYGYLRLKQGSFYRA